MRCALVLIVIVATAACSKDDGGAGGSAAAPVVVKPDALVRTAGQPQIQPDADTAKAMVAAGRSRVITSWKVCVDPRGAVDEVSAQRSSGFVTYDAALAAGIRGWRFQPVMVGGAAVRACTSFTFAWSPS